MVRAPVAAAALFDDLATSDDYDDDGVLAPPYLRAAGLATLAGPYGRPTAAGFYDPKAAEFNRYLLEQQEDLAAEQMAAGSGGSGGGGAPLGQATSDDEEYLAGSSQAGRLIRSRSCMLGPGGQGSSGKNYGVKQSGGKKSGAEQGGGGKGLGGGAGPSWADNGAPGGRSTIG